MTDYNEQQRLLQIKENYLDNNPFKLNKHTLQEDAEAISMFIDFACNNI